MHCKDYAHSVVAGEEDAFWVEHNISVNYPAKISGSVDEILSAFKNLYPICNRKWDEYSKNLKEGNFHFWEHILLFYSISHSNWSKLCSVLQVTQGLSKDHTPDLQSCATKIATS